MKKLTFLSLLLLNMLSVLATNLPDHPRLFNTIDLELIANSTDINPEIYTSSTASFTITNNGSETANNINVAIEIPDGFVLTGSNPYDLTGGTYSSYFGNWKLSNLTPGASETLTLNIYVLTENQVDLYGEVTSVDEADSDSTPANGTPPNPSEDDEAVLNFNEIDSPELPDLIVDEVTVPSSILRDVLTAIEYRFSNIGAGTAEGPFTVYFYYSSDDQLNLGDQQVGQQTFENIPGGSSQIESYNIILLTTFGIPLGEGYLILKIDNDDTVAEANEDNNVLVSSQFSVTTNNNNSEIDLELSLEQLIDNPDQYSSYSVRLSVFNNGSQTATNVTVNIPNPEEVVYTGGNPFNTNIGTFNIFSDLYSIPSIGPGETVELTLNYFLLEPQAPTVYAQVTQADQSDVDSTPNNGTPPIPNEDDEASTETFTPPGRIADLAITNVDIPSIIYKGVPTSFTYRLENIFTGPAEGLFDVSFYYSTDDQLSSDDIEYGRSTFEDLDASDFIDGVFNFTFLEFTSSIPIGPGYFIIKADTDDVILELEEFNNILATPVVITTLDATPDCATVLGLGMLNCIEDAPDGGKILNFTNEASDGTTTGFFREIDADGQLMEGGDLGEIASEITYKIANIADRNNIFQKLENGVLLEERTIPNSIVDNYERMLGGTAFNNGFMIFARNEIDLFAILTDENLNPITNNLIPSQGSFITVPDLNKAIQIAPDQVAFVFSEKNSQAGSLTSLLVINDALEVLSARFLISNQFSSGNIKQTICGDYQVTSSAFTPNCMGQCTYGSTEIGEFVNGEFIAESLNGTFNRDPSNPSEPNTNSFTIILNTSDGGQVVASGGSSFEPNQVSIDISENVFFVSTKTIELDGSIIRMMDISGSIYLVVFDGTDEIIRYYDLDCLEDVAAPTDGADLELTAALSVDAPDIYANYSVVYTLVNNGTEDATGIEVSFLPPAGTVIRGSNPFAISRGEMSTYNNLYTLDELPAGETAVIELNYFSLTDSPINHYAEVSAMNEDDLDSTPNNGTPPTVNEDDETSISTEESASTNSVESSTIVTNVDRLEILKLYPNPIMEKDIRMTLTVPESKEQTLLIYNELGVEVLRTNFDLSSGFNELILPTKNLNAGMYRVILPGHPMRYGSASFMVIK